MRRCTPVHPGTFRRASWLLIELSEYCFLRQAQSPCKSERPTQKEARAPFARHCRWPPRIYSLCQQMQRTEAELQGRFKGAPISDVPGIARMMTSTTLKNASNAKGSCQHSRSISSYSKTKPNANYCAQRTRARRGTPRQDKGKTKRGVWFY